MEFASGVIKVFIRKSKNPVFVVMITVPYRAKAG
jgi:hypothetical protein